MAKKKQAFQFVQKTPNLFEIKSLVSVKIVGLITGA
jgi:hypothetical protein